MTNKPNRTQAAGEGSAAAGVLTAEEQAIIAASAAAEAANKPAGPVEVKDIADVWKVRAFKPAKSRPYPFPDGTGAQTRMAEVIVEIGSTGIFQTGIGIVLREYGATAAIGLRGKKGYVVQLNRRAVGGGNNKTTVAIFEANGEEADAMLDGWRKHVVKLYQMYLKAQGKSAATVAADVFDGDVDMAIE